MYHASKAYNDLKVHSKEISTDQWDWTIGHISSLNILQDNIGKVENDLEKAKADRKYYEESKRNHLRNVEELQAKIVQQSAVVEVSITLCILHSITLYYAGLERFYGLIVLFCISTFKELIEKPFWQLTSTLFVIARAKECNVHLHRQD